MRSLQKLLAVVIVLCSFVVGLCEEQDLRDRYGTRSLEAAQQIARAIELSKASKYKEALAAVDAALKADDRAQMAYYWRGNILSNLGEVPDSIAAYKKSLSSDVTRSRKISASAALNLGLLFGKLNETDESNVYFTQAILADHDNAGGFRANAYRNLSINAENRGQHLSSALALSLAHQDKAKNVTEKRILELFRKAQGQEVARVLYFPEKSPKLEQRQQHTQLSPVAMEGRNIGGNRRFVARPAGSVCDCRSAGQPSLLCDCDRRESRRAQDSGQQSDRLHVLGRRASLCGRQRPATN